MFLFMARSAKNFQVIQPGIEPVFRITNVMGLEIFSGAATLAMTNDFALSSGKVDPPIRIKENGVKFRR